MRWAYGITTVPERRHTTLPRTLASLACAGFDAPCLFIDGCDHSGVREHGYDQLGLKVVPRGERVYTVGNWVLALWQLYVTNPQADRFAIFQDDIICSRSIRDYLERIKWPDKSYYSLYSTPECEVRAPHGFTGFHSSMQLGKGALALVFTRDGAHTLLGSQGIAQKPLIPGERGRTSLDGAIVNAMKAAGYREMVHMPALVNHVGDVSTMGTNLSKCPKPRSFRGEDFDCLTLLDPPQSETEPVVNEQQALRKMLPPGAHKPGKWRNGVIQIWVTRACDKSCFGCTQGSNLRGNPGMITPEQFEEAVVSLKGYFGVVGIFGGNPAMHPKFDLLCEILRKHIPKEQRGLWCNNPLGKGAVMRETFNPRHSNLNVHLDQAAYDEFKRDWPECSPVGLDRDSRHSPVYVAMQDVIPDESERWNLIANCDINKHWSAMVGVFRGQVRAWFCEIAGAQAMLHQHDPNYPDSGLPATPGWWQKPMQDFAAQVRLHCHACGVPLRGRGELAMAADDAGIEQVSATHQDVYKPKRDRQVQLVQMRTEIQEKALPTFVDYIGNSTR